MPKRVLIGTVVSDKGDKTVTVRVDRRVKHPLYGKIIRRSKKYAAHDSDNTYRTGEQVRIEECKPISKSKTWTVIERIGAAKAVAVEIADPDVASPELKADVQTTDAKADKKADAKADKKTETVDAKADETAEVTSADAAEATDDALDAKAEKKPAKDSKSKAKGKAKADDTADAEA
ncbi:30S ribosomal protein S17 [Sphingomonas sabuli]|uniref:Small ribosomal subunit protein uS17 n=1 Tax=Sphingomonas sabuli TaxID=2764186 RepID=A0A7G9L509_9SPHN|nr:30S ribosomal protein S17 [Sphingomonas sabuli]